MEWGFPTKVPSKRDPAVTVTPELQSFIGSAPDSDRYGNVSEVVRAALRLLEERETDHLR